MTTPEERQQKIKEVKELLNELSKIESQSLARKDELSRDINFLEAVPYFEEMLDIIKQLNDRDITRLTSQQLDRIKSSCQTLSTRIRQVQEFTLNQNTPADVCKNIINEVKNTYDTVMEPLIVPLAFTATQSTDYAKIEREAKGYHTTMKEESEKLTKFIEECRIDAEKALNAVREQAAEAGVSTNAQIFLQNAEEHRKVAQKWLIATIFTSVVTLLTAIGFLIITFYFEPKSTTNAIQYVVSKIILLSTLSFGIYWSARNYKANKHNQTLNKHRANALMTFRAFVEGSDDDQIKDAILLQASQAAFSGRPTGYDSSEKELQTVNPIIEVLGKTLTKTSS